MTTTVQVTAHCNDETEVRIELLSDTSFIEEHKLQNGETKSLYVYDDRRIIIKEIPKQK